MQIKTAMKSTSVLALCSALMVPPSLAQDVVTEELATCAITGPFPCVTDEGTRIEDAAELAEFELMGEEDSAVGAEAEADAEAEAEAEVEVENEAEAEVASETETETEVETGSDGETPVAEDEVAEDQPAVETTTDPAPDEEKGLIENTVDALTGEDDDVAEDPATTQDTTEERPAEETTAGEEIEENTDAETVQAPEPDAPADQDEGLVEELAEDLTETGEDAAEQTEATVEDITEALTIPETPVEDEAPEAAAAAEADVEQTDAELAADEDVVVEEVTEAETRSSGEEFETTVSSSTDATATTNGDTTEATGFNRKLTDFEKLLLVGLGGVAVGTILANGNEIIGNTGDRIVVENPDGTLSVLKNDDIILRQPGSVISTKSYDDGSTRTVIERQNGERVVTVRAADGTVLKRVRVLRDGTRVVLFDDTRASEPVSNADVASYTPASRTTMTSRDQEALRQALLASMTNQAERTFSLRQIRLYPEIRALAPVIEVDAVTFDTGSAVIKPTQAEQLARLGRALRDVVAEVPGAVFLIEGHTDTVGGAGYNLALSDRRAESVALALTEYFDVPPENLITQGYGESELEIVAQGDIRENRRANVRNITPLLQ